MKRTYLYWPKHRPIPRGWVLSSTFQNHHGQYSVIIRKLVAREKFAIMIRAIGGSIRERTILRPLWESVVFHIKRCTGRNS